MRRAIVELLREKPMTQTQLADELGLTVASLSYHIKLLKSQNLVKIHKKKAEAHGIVQIFYSTSAYHYVYDLKALPRDIARYFYPIALERIRAVISVLLLNDKELGMKKDSQSVTNLSNDLSELIVSAATSYRNRNVNFGNENVIFDIYVKALKNFV